MYPVHTEFQHSVLNLYAMASERSDFLSGEIRRIGNKRNEMLDGTGNDRITCDSS